MTDSIFSPNNFLEISEFLNSEVELKIYNENNIISRYDVRVDIAYYNESEPDINKLKEGKEAEYTCCICGDDFEGFGNNPAPYKESGKCCDACNRKFVIPARIAQIAEEDKTYKACIISDSYAKAKELVVINNTTKQYAQDKINALYKSAFIDNNIIKYIPFLHSDIEKVKSLDELKTKYFCNPNVHDGINYKNLLGPDTYLGFTETDFISQFQEAYKNHKQLLKDLEVKE